MKNQATCKQIVTQTLGFSAIDQNIQDDDFIYSDYRSLKVVPPSETNLLKTQESLCTLLCKKLKRAGRKSLAERLLKKQEPLTYKELIVLTQQIKNPRTKQTLLHNSTQLFSTIPLERLPHLVREDMEGKGIPGIPESIYLLHQIMTCPEFEMHSIELIKHLSTQLMQIDVNTTFETLEEEYEDCAKLLLTPGSNREETRQQMDCISKLEGLHDIWTQQNPADWNQVIHKHTPQTSSLRLTEHQEIQIHEDQAQAKESPSLASTTVAWETAPDQTTESPDKTIIWQPTTGISSQSKPTLLPYAEPENLVPANEPASKERLPTPFLELKRREPSPHRGAIPVSSQSALPPEPQSTDQTTTLTAPKGGARPKEVILSVPAPAVAQHVDINVPRQDVLPHRGATPGSVQSEIPPEAQSTDQTTAVPEPMGSEVTTIRGTYDPALALKEGIEIESQEELEQLTIDHYLALRKDFYDREKSVLAFIDDPTNKQKRKAAQKALKSGFWPAGRLLDLLNKCDSISDKKGNFFEQWREELFRHSGFSNGIAPKDARTNIPTMHAVSRTLHETHEKHYITKSNFTSTEALDSCVGKSFWVCNNENLFQLSNLMTMRKYLGDTTFNFHFSGPSKLALAPMKVELKKPSEFIRRGTIAPLLKHKIETERGFIRGNFYLFVHHRSYLKKHINGEYDLLLALCTDIVKPDFCVAELCDSEDLEGITKILINLYNKTPYNNTIMKKTGWDALKKGSEPGQPSKKIDEKTFSEGGGKMSINFPIALDLEKLKRLKQASFNNYEADLKKQITQEESSVTTKIPEEHPLPDEESRLVISLQEMQLKLHKLCEERNPQLLLPEITDTKNEISKLIQEIENREMEITEELRRQIDEDLRISEEIRKLPQLERLRLKLQNLCEEEKALQREPAIRKRINEIKALQREITTIPEELTLKIHETLIIAEEICKLAPLEQKRLQLHAQCREGKLLPMDLQINQTIKDIKKIIKELKEEGIIIPEHMDNRIKNDFLVSEELRNK